MYSNNNRYGRRSSGYNRFQKRKPRSFGGVKIDPNKYICKASPVVSIMETKTVNNFEDFGVDPILLENIKAKGFNKPTPIQDQVIPKAIEGCDILGIANTGTGKTAAFAIPLIDKILKNPKERILILAPTRELATQIKQDIRSFTYGLKIYIALAIGGAYLREQIIDIKRGPHIVVGTPGRISDLARRRVINFSVFDTVVLDEVDRMLDMGFVDEIKGIMDQIPENRQTLFFSATIDRKIEGLIDSFLHNPVKISVKTQDTSTHVEQDIVRVDRNRKMDKLIELLAKPDFNKVLVFGGTKMIVEKISQSLIQKGFKADSIHGDKRQFQRNRVLTAFKSNQISVLVATDVAARGLDVADITHVINYDQPANFEDYTHRIGRTGRGDKIGTALTFVDQY
ncbi:MAG TPA: DEAD/DEAH box helicase [Candidatus Woesebacteria bacterium]|nr:DEAD/DEAH box helicase [Candidatus Woesebacteria bacterium]